MNSDKKTEMEASYNIKVEKRLCEMLGRPWTVCGISTSSLLDDVEAILKERAAALASLSPEGEAVAWRWQVAGVDGEWFWRMSHAKPNFSVSLPGAVRDLQPLYAALPASRPGWLDIESAPPTPSQRIVAAIPDGSRWFFCEAYFEEVAEEWTDVRSDRYVTPTHWMPLPPLPAARMPERAA